MSLLSILMTVAAAVLGGGVSFIWLSRRLNQAFVERAQAIAECRSAVTRARELQVERDQTRVDLERLKIEHATSSATLEAERRAALEQLNQIRAMQDRLDGQMKETFSAMATSTLQVHGKQIVELAKAEFTRVSETSKVDLEGRQKAIELSLKPMDESLKRVGEALDKTRAESAQLFSQVKMLGSETSNLVKALRTPHVRGRWGEQTLRRVVEMAQMVNHCDFIEQHTVDGPESRLRPDLIVRMPQGRTVVVDAKAPLDRYLSMVEAQDDQARLEHLKAHGAQVRDHITKLSSRQYWEALSPSPELVVMFLPSESLLSAALQDDPNLIEFSVTRQVILASPLTLVTLLKAVAYGWRQVEVQNNAEQIRQLGQELYSRIRVMAEHFQDLGQKLQSSVNSYNRTVGSLEHKVLSGARKFVDLGAASKEQAVPLLASVETLPRVLAAEEMKPARAKSDNGQRDLLRSVGG